MCRRCSTNMRRGSKPRWSTISAIAARRCCSRRCCRCASAARKPAFFKRAIDLGCGTGLAAAAFAKEVDHFIGIDLSPRMIERARATGLYAELEVADMLQGLRAQAGRQRRSHSRRGCDGLCRRSRAGAAPKPRACWRPAGCSPSPPKPMTAKASSSARGCAMPMRRPMCAPRSKPPASNCPCWKIAPPATRTTRRCPAWSSVAAKT